MKTKTWYLGYLLVDPPRYHRVFEFTYGTTEDKDGMESRFQPCFVEEIRSLKRFQEFTTANVVGQFQAWLRHDQRLWELKRDAKSDDKMLESLIVDVMTSCARDNISQLLPALSKSLDELSYLFTTTSNCRAP